MGHQRYAAAGNPDFPTGITRWIGGQSRHERRIRLDDFRNHRPPRISELHAVVTTTFTVHEYGAVMDGKRLLKTFLLLAGD